MDRETDRSCGKVGESDWVHTPSAQQQTKPNPILTDRSHKPNYINL